MKNVIYLVLSVLLSFLIWYLWQHDMISLDLSKYYLYASHPVECALNEKHPNIIGFKIKGKAWFFCSPQSVGPMQNWFTSADKEGIPMLLRPNYEIVKLFKRGSQFTYGIMVHPTKGMFFSFGNKESIENIYTAQALAQNFNYILFVYDNNKKPVLLASILDGGSFLYYNLAWLSSAVPNALIYTSNVLNSVSFCNFQFGYLLDLLPTLIFWIIDFFLALILLPAGIIVAIIYNPITTLTSIVMGILKSGVSILWGFTIFIGSIVFFLFSVLYFILRIIGTIILIIIGFPIQLLIWSWNLVTKGSID